MDFPEIDYCLVLLGHLDAVVGWVIVLCVFVLVLLVVYVTGD